MDSCTAGAMGLGLSGGSQRIADIHDAGPLCHSCAMWPAAVPLCLGPFHGGCCAAVAVASCCHCGSLPLCFCPQLQTVSSRLQACFYRSGQAVLIKVLDVEQHCRLAFGMLLCIQCAFIAKQVWLFDMRTNSKPRFSQCVSP